MLEAIEKPDNTPRRAGAQLLNSYALASRTGSHESTFPPTPLYREGHQRICSCMGDAINAEVSNVIACVHCVSCKPDSQLYYADDPRPHGEYRVHRGSGRDGLPSTRDEHDTAYLVGRRSGDSRALPRGGHPVGANQACSCSWAVHRIGASSPLLPSSTSRSQIDSHHKQAQAFGYSPHHHSASTSRRPPTQTIPLFTSACIGGPINDLSGCAGTIPKLRGGPERPDSPGTRKNDLTSNPPRTILALERGIIR